MLYIPIIQLKIIRRLQRIRSLLDNTEAATRHYLRASELDPTWPRPHYGLGRMMQDLERRPEAISHYQTALAIHPGLNEARLELAQLLLNDGDVALVPGSAFGAPGYLRLSFACGLDTLGEAVARIGRVLG